MADIAATKGFADNFNVNPIFPRSCLISDLPYTSRNILVKSENHKHTHVLPSLFHASRFYLSH